MIHWLCGKNCYPFDNEIKLVIMNQGNMGHSQRPEDAPRG